MRLMQNHKSAVGRTSERRGSVRKSAGIAPVCLFNKILFHKNAPSLQRAEEEARGRTLPALLCAWQPRAPSVPLSVCPSVPLSVCPSDAPRACPAWVLISPGCSVSCTVQRAGHRQGGVGAARGLLAAWGLPGPPLGSAPLHGQRRVKPTPRSPGPGCLWLDFTLEFEIRSYKETFIFLPFNDQTSGVEAQGSRVSISRAVFFLL